MSRVSLFVMRCLILFFSLSLTRFLVAGADVPLFDFAAARATNWAYRAPRPPAVPSVKNKQWPRSPLDHFILAKLEERGVLPAPPADARTLIRRLTFDLIGLPPTPKEVAEFVQAAGRNRDAAVASLIERLLASPHYGERWARHWLDVVRYTDSFDARGLGGKGDVSEAWRYRDWVVNAFNRDLPYDQFIVQQFAGDILATNTPGRFDADALIATGVFVIGEWGTGDADKEKMLTDIVDDQIDVTGRAFLGLTLACARCHDHKFDPITTKDYYALAGIFFSSHILPDPGVKTDGSPVLRIPLASAAEIAARKEKESRVAALDKEINAKAGAAMLTKPERGQFNQPALSALHLTDGPDLPNAVANAGDTPARFLTITLPPRAVAIHPSPERGAAAVWQSTVRGKVEVRGRVADADDKCGNGAEWTLYHGQQSLASGKFDNGKDAGIASREVEVAPGDLIHLAITARGKDHSCDTTEVQLEVREIAGAQRRWRLPEDVVADLPALANSGAWHFIAFAGTPPSVLSATNLSDAERESLGRARKELAALRKELEKPLPVAHGLQEGGTPKSAHAGFNDARVHIRGRYDRLGEFVPRAYPQVLAGDAAPPAFGTNTSGRLALARWIASPDNPLTARVMVNRIWQHHFGEGLVATPNNFGKLGTPPVHPELLDWLAAEFVKSGWSFKAMHRLMLSSATYQQAGQGTVTSDSGISKSVISEPVEPGKPVAARRPTDSLNTDSLNTDYFTPFPRRRLESEALRDSLLAGTGELDRALGGPAVRDLNIKRRTLYVMTVRSDRATYQSLFDAADCTGIAEKRITSTVAPQALFLMNSPFILERTKALAARALQDAPGEDGARIDWLYERLYGRVPTFDEKVLGLRAVQRREGAGNDTAWERYCQVLLCANEFAYVD